MLEIIHEATNRNPNLTVTIILTPNLTTWINTRVKGPCLKLFTRVLSLTLTLI